MAPVNWMYSGVLSMVGGVPGSFIDEECFTYNQSMWGWIRLGIVMGLYPTLMGYQQRF